VNKKRFSKLGAFFWLLRPGRTVMVAMIAGTAAFAAGAGIARTLWMTLAGWCLAVGGFAMDFYADRDLDRAGPRARTRHNPLANPLADGSLAPSTGLAWSLFFIAASLAVTLAIAPRAAIPWVAILALIAGLALHLLETPLARALTLGALQALYVFLGASAGALSPGLALFAAMLFFAMCGGRGMTDIRDYPQDQRTRVQTLPKRYGIVGTVRFTAVCLLICYALSLAVYLTGEFGVVYLYLDLALIVTGLACTWFFAAHPTPRVAYVLTMVFMMGQGFVFCLAIILASIW
jgi:4-hydroxybenzoate polyprenyltransferase